MENCYIFQVTHISEIVILVSSKFYYFSFSMRVKLGGKKAILFIFKHNKPRAKLN